MATDFYTNFHAYSEHYAISWLSHPITAFLRRFHNDADCTLVPTHEMAAELGRLHFERLRVVGRGVNTKAFFPQCRCEELRAGWGAGPKTMVAMCVSQFSAEKNFPLVIEPFERMRETRPDSKLVLFGDEPLVEKLRKSRQRLCCCGTESQRRVVGSLGFSRYISVSERLAPFGDKNAYIAHAVDLARNPDAVRRLGAEARLLAQKLSGNAIVLDFEAALFSLLAEPNHSQARTA